MIEVYRNLHKNCLSVREGGLVIEHAARICIWNPRFVVQPAGRERVVREQRKNVHAFVRGERGHLPHANFTQGVRYNPYVAPFFFMIDSGQEVVSAPYCLLSFDKVLIPYEDFYLWAGAKKPIMGDRFVRTGLAHTPGHLAGIPQSTGELPPHPEH